MIDPADSNFRFLTDLLNRMECRIELYNHEILIQNLYEYSMLSCCHQHLIIKCIVLMEINVLISIIIM